MQQMKMDKANSEVVSGRLMDEVLIDAIRKYHKLKMCFYHIRVLKVRILI